MHRPSSHARSSRFFAAIVFWWVGWLALGGPVAAQAQRFELPTPHAALPIEITAQSAQRWDDGPLDVWVLEGACRISQGPMTAQSDQAVVWISREGPPELMQHRVVAYLEGSVHVQYARSGAAAAVIEDESWFGEWVSAAPLDVRVAQQRGEPAVRPAVYRRAHEMRRGDTAAAALTTPAAFSTSSAFTASSTLAASSASAAARAVQPPAANTPPRGLPPGGAVQPAQFTPLLPQPGLADPPPPATRRIRAFPRSNVPVVARVYPSELGNESVVVIDAGVNLIVDGLPNLGTIDVSTDRMVIWTAGLSETDLTGGQTLQPNEMPLELYMEGNIIFRQGDRVVRAQRMYYDVRQELGIVIDAELLTPVSSYQGTLRLKADILRQTGRNQFHAERGYVTSSRFAQPGYRLQSGSLLLEDDQQLVIDPFTGEVQVDPETGEPLVVHDRTATSRNNFLFLGPVPVFYWPVLAADLEEPTFYLRRIRLRNDRIFGTGVLTSWNAYQLLGIRNPPQGTEWDVNVDYLSERGLGYGTAFKYQRQDLLGVPADYMGFADAWFINDDGIDNLGGDRSAVPLEESFRGRVLFQHRHRFRSGYQLTGEAGWVSDRNFLEAYYENEWDEFKDQTTGIELKRLIDNQSWSLTADVRVNEYFAQTEWLPRGDHFWLGQSLLGDWLTWYEHSSAGFGRLREAATPNNPVDLAKFRLLPWEADRSGERVFTRQEIDLPLSLGPMKVVPYALGELAHWGEDLAGDDLQRAYGQVGVRASLPLWTVNPAIENSLWNVHGVAHKITLGGELGFADASRDLTDLPLYDPLDDDSVEQFRRRFGFNVFNPVTGDVPLRFDERFYALRSNLGSWVTSPSPEVADDLAFFRLDANQRWQTKRGLPGQRRIIDWIELDTGLSFFPDADRDNFGESLGLADFDFRWHVGDRLTLLSGGIFDFFEDGQQLIHVGGFLNRPPRGNVYVGFRLLEGPIESKVLGLSYSYHMSPKWISVFGTSIDFGRGGNIGNRLALTRVGESLLVSVGLNFDESKDNLGVNLSIEPRFLPSSRLGRQTGAQIPPAGAFGLE